MIRHCFDHFESILMAILSLNLGDFSVECFNLRNYLNIGAEYNQHFCLFNEIHELKYCQNFLNFLRNAL